MWMILTVVLAAAGGMLLQRLKVPGGMLVGAILGAAALNLWNGEAFIYQQAQVAAQALTGAYVGCLVTRQDVVRLPRLIGPYLTLMGCLLALNFAMGAFVYAVTEFDLLTCLLCTAPGGMTDIPLIAMDMGADASVVAVMQFVRMMFGLSCLPTLIVLADRAMEPGREAISGHSGRRNRGKGGSHPTLRGFLPTFAVALAAAVFGKWTGIPAGAMSAALIATAAMKLTGHCPGMPMWLRRVAQVVSGCCIGAEITRGQVMQLTQLALPAAVLCVGYVLCCVLAGWLLHRVFAIDLREAMFCLSPAGATETALIAADLGVESANLAVLQVCRFIGVVLFYPQIFRLVLWLF